MPPVPVLLMNSSLGHGGCERQLSAIALHLDAQRFQAHAACKFGGFRLEELEQAGVPTLRFHQPAYLSRGALQDALNLRSYVRSHGIRLIHTFDQSIGVFGVLAGRFFSRAAVLSSQRCEMRLIPEKYQAVTRWCHKLADGVVANSEAIRTELIEKRICPPEKVHVCHNGVDTTTFHPRGRRRIPELERASVVVGVVCVLRPEKNLPTLMRAFAVLLAADPAAQLVIAGSGPERGSLEALAAELSLQNNCLFLSSAADVADLMRSIDIFVHPSLSEALPNAVMEALACGCCVLSSNVGGCPEIISHGENGMLFPPEDLDTLTALLLAARDTTLRERLSSSGTARIVESFSIETSARRMERIYETALAASS
jgi:glycosyltransferase involved in cell wall biosynthesis